MARWGGFKNGKSKYSSQWSEMRSSSALRNESVASTPTQFSYVEGKGIWNLRSTTEFPQSNKLAALSLAFVSSSSSTGTSITIPSSSQAGDIAIMFASHHGDEVSSNKTLPSGWTKVREDFDSLDSVMVSGYKVLTAGDVNLSINPFSSFGAAAVAVFRPSKAISSVSTFSINGQATIGDPSAQVIDMTLAPSYNSILAVSFMSGTTTLVESVPGSMTKLSASSSASAFYQIFSLEDTLTSLTVDMPDEGDNAMQSWGLAIN